MRYRFLLPFIFSAVAFAQQPSKQNQEMSHTRDGFMQGRMHHAIAKGVTLDAKTDSSAHTITLRVGPLNLPANTSHMKMPQPPDLVWTIPVTGWLLAYHPKLVDATGDSVPGIVLHHVAFWNENRSDFLCPNKEEHVFGAGGELTDWALIPGFGYRVEKDDRIRIETMIHNPTSTAYDKAYLEVTIPYFDDASPAPVKNIYPTWIDVGTCGSSSYDLPPGPSKKVASVPVKYSGVLLGVGGHMHDYGQQLTLEISSARDSSTDASRTEVSKPEGGGSLGVARAEVAKTEASKAQVSKTDVGNAEVPKGGVVKAERAKAKEPIAVLPAKTDAEGHLLGIPVVMFFQTGGYPIDAGDQFTVTSAYNNPTGKLLRDGAMGIVVGYFVPQEPSGLNALRHPATVPPQAHDSHSHDMPHHSTPPTSHE